MGRTSKWLRSFLTGKKEKGVNQEPTLVIEGRSTPIAVPTVKEKRRWSFRRSEATATVATAGKELSSPDILASTPTYGLTEAELDHKRHAMAVAVATAAAADAAVAAAQAAAAVIRLTAKANGGTSAIEEAAAIKIQSVFRSYLARKALCALKGLVKLQALVRGHLVRKQATATLRCMQALVTAQERARVQRIRMLEEGQTNLPRQSIHRRSPQPRHRQSYEKDRTFEDNVKIVEMDLGESRGSAKSRNSYSITQSERKHYRFHEYYGGSHKPSNMDLYHQVSPSPSALTDISPKACSSHFEEFSFNTAQSSPQYYSVVSMPPDMPKVSYSMSYDYPFYPNYMANTESSRAKARSQSAPKQRPEYWERQPSRRKPSVEGRNIPRAVRMQRSSSHMGTAASGYQYPWSIKLDKSSMSLKDSECGSTNTVMTNINYCRSLAAYEVHGSRH